MNTSEVMIPCSIPPMKLDDLDEVMAIEKASFSMPWPASAYRYELLHNRMAHYYVVRLKETGTFVPPRSLWQRLLQRKERRAGHSPMLGYGGFWLMGDEAHISTIAVDPSYRQKGIGERLMLHIMGEAIELRAKTVTLEVRTSNLAAQHLYEKIGFVKVGQRKGYYHDGQEDAIIMRVENVHAAKKRSIEMPR